MTNVDSCYLVKPASTNLKLTYQARLPGWGTPIAKHRLNMDNYKIVRTGLYLTTILEQPDDTGSGAFHLAAFESHTLTACNVPHVCWICSVATVHAFESFST